METHQHFLMDPQTKQELVQAQFIASSGKAAPTITREKTKEIYLD
jgi:hypothetical protein